MKVRKGEGVSMVERLKEGEQMRLEALQVGASQKASELKEKDTQFR